MAAAAGAAEAALAAAASPAAADRAAAAAPRGAGEMTLDHDRIEAAVTAAEQGSRGEIVCILSHEVSGYPEIPLAWGAATALVIPPIAVALGLRPLALASPGGDWTIAHAAAID